MNEKSDGNSFGSVLSRLRKKHGLTQRELAIRLNVHVTTVKNWEGNACSPDAKNLCVLADLFHVTTDYLLGREKGDRISLECLDPDERRQLLQMIQAYIDSRPSRKNREKSR